VLTTDRRGIGRSVLDDPGQESTPELRADDLSRLNAHLDAGPAAVLGSSGGAITALALAQSHPGQVHTVVAHEPPRVELLDDRDKLHAQTDELIADYLAGDVIGAWTKFMRQADIAMPEEVIEAMFGGDREPQVVADERRWFAHELRATTHWRPDLGALRAAPTHIIAGIGEESAGQLATAPPGHSPPPWHRAHRVPRRSHRLHQRSRPVRDLVALRAAAELKKGLGPAGAPFGGGARSHHPSAGK
jgi:pimeloyl-ACP methyl ester carboxylesterase